MGGGVKRPHSWVLCHKRWWAFCPEGICFLSEQTYNRWNFPMKSTWMMCFLLMTFVPFQKLCVYTHIYIYICVCVCIYYMSSVFFGLPIVLLSDDNSLIPGCLWLLAFVLNNTLILGIWCSTIPHLPGCFYPWTFFPNIGFNMVPSDPFMSYLATQLGYFAGEFQTLQLIVLATFGVVD